MALSRLLLCRHHILDVVAGVLLGSIEALLFSYIWIGQDWSKWILSSFLSGEKLPGTTEEEDTF